MAHEGRGGGLKKSRSKTDEPSGSVEAGLGIWKDWSKSSHVGTVGKVKGSDTACKRPPSIPLGRLDREELESLSDKHLFFGGSEGGSACKREVMA